MAPPLIFSTMTDCGQAWPSLSASRRARVAGVEPPAAGTPSLTTRDGKTSCAPARSACHKPMRESRAIALARQKGRIVFSRKFLCPILSPPRPPCHACGHQREKIMACIVGWVERSETHRLDVNHRGGGLRRFAPNPPSMLRRRAEGRLRERLRSLPPCGGRLGRGWQQGKISPAVHDRTTPTPVPSSQGGGERMSRSMVRAAGGDYF